MTHLKPVSSSTDQRLTVDVNEQLTIERPTSKIFIENFILGARKLVEYVESEGSENDSFLEMIFMSLIK